MFLEVSFVAVSPQMAQFNVNSAITVPWQVALLRPLAIWRVCKVQCSGLVAMFCRFPGTAAGAWAGDLSF